MTTMGQVITARLDTLERLVAGIRDKKGDGAVVDELENQIQQLMEQVALIQSKADQFPVPPGNSSRSPSYQKEMMPEILGNNYKEKWRVWSYKTRDWLAQWDESLRTKLEEIEAQSTELTDEQLKASFFKHPVTIEIKIFITKMS